MKKKHGKGSVNENLKPTERLLIHKACFDEGIIPIETELADVGVSLSQLPPEEARKMKRKFRKLWRREAKRRSINLKDDSWSSRYASRQYGKSGEHPNRYQKVARKRVVMERIRSEKIRPILTRINNPDGK